MDGWFKLPLYQWSLGWCVVGISTTPSFQQTAAAAAQVEVLSLGSAATAPLLLRELPSWCRSCRSCTRTPFPARGQRDASRAGCCCYSQPGMANSTYLGDTFPK